MQVLSEKEEEKVKAAVEGIGVFVDTLLLISKAQDEVSARGKPVPQSEPMDFDAVCTLQDAASSGIHLWYAIVQQICNPTCNQTPHMGSNDKNVRLLL